MISLRHERTPGLRARGPLVALLSVLALTSCHATASIWRGGPAVGPMQSGQDRGTYCGPKNGESDFVLGIDALTDTGDHHLVLDSATLEGAVNVTESSSYVTEIRPGRGGDLFGVVPGSPPRFFAKGQAAQWARRRPVRGTLVPPESSGDLLNLLVVVHSPDPDVRASVKNLVVRYHSDRQHYVWTGDVTYQLAPGDDCPTPRRFRD